MPFYKLLRKADGFQ
jgi:ribonuclease HI